MKKENNISIQFLGAAGTVTGSKFHIKTNTKSILIDCGMFQGLKKLRILNWEKLPINVSAIDCVILTHGHLDHVGYLPKLVKSGFKGKIYGTEPTLEVAKLILEDSARIQEEDAERANDLGFSKHKPAKPLYKLRDVKNTIPHFEAKQLDTWIKIDNEISFRYRYNGHIIGATFIELKIGRKLFVFSGDIGRSDDLLMSPPQKPDKADILFIESTYGNRVHPSKSDKQLIDVINEVATKGGTIIIPSFAVERTQMLMYNLWKLRKNGKIPNIPVYLDSPMGNKVLNVFQHNTSWHKLPMKDCFEMNKEIKNIETIEDTYKLIKQKGLRIIIAGSGMVSGGRVLTYLQHYLADAKATILLVGYQAEGTRGRQLLEGAKEIKLLGQFYKVKAEVKNIEGLSAHADQPGLLNWLSNIKKAPEKIFIVHGEAQSADAFRVKLKDTYGWDAEIPDLNEIVKIKP